MEWVTQRSDVIVKCKVKCHCEMQSQMSLWNAKSNVIVKCKVKCHCEIMQSQMSLWNACIVKCSLGFNSAKFESINQLTQLSVRQRTGVYCITFTANSVTDFVNTDRSFCTCRLLMNASVFLHHLYDPEHIAQHISLIPWWSLDSSSPRVTVPGVRWLRWVPWLLSCPISYWPPKSEDTLDTDTLACHVATGVGTGRWQMWKFYQQCSCQVAMSKEGN